MKKNGITVCLIATALLIFSLSAHAGNIYVNNLTGSDSNNGLSIDKPFKTIRKAVAEVKPGDSVHLANTGSPYKESLVLNNVNGTAEKRITFDGHGATLSGCQPLNLTEWKQIAPGLYKNSIFYAANRFVGDFTRIYFFLFDGKINRMGRSRKGPNAAFKKPEDLGENEWTFTENDSSFYLKINPAKRLQDCNIEQPVRSNAVAVSGTTSYVTVKNIICTHVYNDGFGITGTPKKLIFENIQSHYCGDDGISAHAFSQFEVYGFVSIGNATGIADSGTTDTYYDGVVIKDCIGTDIFFVQERPGEAIHTIKNVLVFCNGANPVVMTTQKPDGHMIVKMENVLVLGNKNRDTMIRMDGQTEWYAKNCSFRNLNLFLKGKSANMEGSIITGTNSLIAPGNSWTGRKNIYVWHQLTLNNTAYSAATAKSIRAYQTDTRDTKSVWSHKQVSSTPAKTSGVMAGADISKMPLKNEILKQYFVNALALEKNK